MTPIEIAHFLQEMHRLPSLSAVVLELLSSLNHDEVNSELLVTKIGQDQALSARTLKLANSSFYGMTFRSTTIRDAVSILGSRTVRRLASSAALIVAFPGNLQSGFDVRSLWHHAIATALCAGELARLTQSDQDIAYVAGLLHDVGRLALATQFPNAYDQAMAYRAEHSCSVTTAEMATLGINHSIAGAALIRHWNLALPLQQALASHHSELTQDADLLSVIVQSANAIAHALNLLGEPSVTQLNLPESVLQRLGLDGTAMDALQAKVMQQFIAASSALDH